MKTKGSEAKTKEPSRRLREWVAAKRRCGLSDAHIQMARELGLSPKRLAASAGTGRGPIPVPLSQRVEGLYLKRFKRTIPDSVVPLRQLLREALARERTDARARKRRRRRSELDHVEAARISLLTLWRLCNAVGLEGFSLPGGPAAGEPDIDGQEVK